MVLRLALPLQLTPGAGLASLTQDSPAEVAQSVALLLATRPGDRRSVPGYGLADPVFVGLDVGEVVTTIATWEDRADPAYAELVADDLVEQNASVYPASPSQEDQ